MDNVRQPLNEAQPLTAAQPLTEAQSGLWFAQRLAPLNPAFNTAHVLWLAGDLNISAFTAAANQAVTEAESLSLRFAHSDAGPQQWREASAIPLLEIVDLSGQYQTLATAKAAAEIQMQADYLTALDPARDRLAKQVLFILDDQHFAWYLRVHHLANDGYGMALLAERVNALYGGDTSSRAFAPLEPVLIEDAEYQGSERRTKDAAYWQQAFSDVPPPASLAGEASSGSGYQCHRKTVALDQALMAELQHVAEAEQLPWPDLLTALTAEYCRRHTDSDGHGNGEGNTEGKSEAVVGVPFMGRLGSKSARLPAMVMNVLPLALRDLSGTAEQAHSLSHFLQHTARELTRGRRHGRYRGEQLRRDLGLIGGQRRLYGPLINVQPFYSPLLWPALTSQLDILSTGPVDDMTLGFRGDAKAALDLEIEANAALYSVADVNDHAARLPAFLRSAFAVYQADGQLQDIALATTAEAERYLYEVNATAHSVPSTSLVALFEAQMAATPEAIALVFNGERLTYAELEIRTRALALQLIKQGVTADSLVAVALPRSFELVIALVAIQRAGGAYLPLDAAQPDERLMRILSSAKPVCVLSHEAARFGDLAQTVLAPQDWQADAAAKLEVSVAPRDAAYVIYTSGSTGEPKGVLVEHQAIVNRLLWMQDYFAIDANERILQKTPATFDVSVWEFFLPLLAGAQLVIAPPDAHQDPRLIAELIREYDITTLHFVPSMLAAFLATPNISDLTPKRVIVSGEALSASLRDRFHQTLNSQSVNTRLFNLYGPTEAAVDVSVWEASTADTSSSVPIGVPVWNTQLYVLDSQQRPLPPGVAGDLYLGGVQLARGYLGQPELTAATFIEHKGQRLYKSGDVARFRRDGAVEYLGRSDDQVKLRGLRIELGDINHALSTAPGIASAEVLLRTVNGGEPRLVAYIEPTASAQATQLEAHVLRAHLAAHLPEYMVPSVFVPVREWPLSANGKLNRKALPQPDIAQSAGGELNSDTERALAGLFAEQLNIAQAIGAEDDFFALGGDSLSAVHLLLAIQARWHWDPGFGALFANPTVAGLAALIDAPQDKADDGLGAYVRLSEGQAELAPLFTIHPAGGIAWNYRELAQTLAPKRTVYGLQSPALQLPAQQSPALQTLNQTAQPPMEESIDALAARYVATLTTLYPSGPVHLVGWSVGGIIAHAMAICLREQGREVGVLALLDAYPAECWRAEPEPSPVAALRALLAIAGYDPELHLNLDSREKIVAFLRQGDSTLGNLPEAALDGVVRAVTSTNLLVRGHYHGRFDGTMMHLRAGRDHVTKPQLQSSLWSEYAAKIEAIELPYLHAEMTGRDASARIAPLLATRMAEYEQATRMVEDETVAAQTNKSTQKIQETSCS